MIRLIASAIVLLALLQAGQQETPSPSPYATEREPLLAPTLEALKQQHYADALHFLEGVLPAYPSDSRVLLLTGNAALRAGEPARAVTLYKTMSE